MKGDPRVERLVIVNSPHPWIFQKSLIEDPAQRAASQYINAFRDPGFEAMVEAKGFDWFFERTFSLHVDLAAIPVGEREIYVEQWSRAGALTAMVNWYRASPLVVPPPGARAPVPDFLLRFAPKIRVPAHVIWGMRDAALLPIQLKGLDSLVENLAIVRLPEAGHFAPWEAPEEVAAALGDFLA